MKLIVGLGNPGEKYLRTRHNVGFLALDNFLVNIVQIDPKLFWSNDPLAQTINLAMENEKILFVKPQTFMNNSGKAVSHLANFYKIPVEEILIVHDEVDLPLGTVRETNSSSSAGHNGIKSIIEHLGTQKFYRLRVGVESRETKAHMPTDAFVLENFSPPELLRLKEEVLPGVNEKISQFIKK